MKNIGIITHNFPYSLTDRQNAGIFVNDIAQKIAKNNNVSVFCPNEGHRKNKIGKVKITNFPVISGNKLGNLNIWNPIDYLRFAVFFVSGTYNLSKFIKNNNIKVNLAMWSFPSGVFALIAKKIYGIPYVTWCLGSDIYIFAKKPILKYLIKIILRNSSFVFADGVDLSNETTKIAGVKCLFIPSASEAKFNSKVVYKKEKIIKLAFVGRLELVKGPDIFIQALTRLKNSISKFKIDIIGDGSLMPGLKEIAKDNGISSRMTYHGNVSNFQKISDIVKKADWLVIPSRSDSIPLVFSESMKCGTPIIASNLPDLKYLVDKYNIGIIFKKDDITDLASIIMKLPKLDKNRKDFSLNTKIVAKEFTVSKTVFKILSYLKNI